MEVAVPVDVAAAELVDDGGTMTAPDVLALGALSTWRLMACQSTSCMSGMARRGEETLEVEIEVGVGGEGDDGNSGGGSDSKTDEVESKLKRRDGRGRDREPKLLSG
jgi:hypothetical protein